MDNALDEVVIFSSFFFVKFFYACYPPCLDIFLPFLCQVCTGATYVSVDMLENQKDRSRMLLIEGNQPRFCCWMCFRKMLRNSILFISSNFFFWGYIHLKSLADNGGGMNPDKIRDCMSLGFSRKSQIANTIGQCMKLESNQSAFGFLSFSNNHVSCLFIQMEMDLKQVP